MARYDSCAKSYTGYKIFFKVKKTPSLKSVDFSVLKGRVIEKFSINMHNFAEVDVMQGGKQNKLHKMVKKGCFKAFSKKCQFSLM